MDSFAIWLAPVTVDGNNHISGLTMDASGNTLADGFNTYVWDGESQLKSASGSTFKSGTRLTVQGVSP